MAAFDLAPSCRPNQRFLKFFDYIFVRCFIALINLNMAPAKSRVPFCVLPWLNFILIVSYFLSLKLISFRVSSQSTLLRTQRLVSVISGFSNFLPYFCHKKSASFEALIIPE
jgi:hypothetical protein